MSIKFYVIGKNKERITSRKPESLISDLHCEFPYFVMFRDYFDDINYKTSYFMDFYVSKESKKEIGSIRILDIKDPITELDDIFEKLNNERYCSLGEDIEFYEKLMLLGDKIFESALHG